MLETDNEIRKRVELRYEKRQDLFKKIACFVGTAVILWVIFHESWVFWAALAMSIGGVVSSIVEYYNKYGGGAERREAEIQREMERRGVYEKPKNKDVQMRLSDDGELEAVPDGEISGTGKVKRIS